MQSGYIPALGTPVDENGNFLAESFKKQVDDQIKAGAVGLLCMGSMGQQPYLRSGICPEVARAAVEAAAGRAPVFIGAMDNSVARVKDRLSALEGLDVAGFVFTTPYYYASNRGQMLNFFEAVAASTRKKYLLYDLAVVTQTKITGDVVLELLRKTPNLAGIKSADLQMFRQLKLHPEVPDDFIMVYSGLDTADVAYKWGISNCLDGMFSCTPVNSSMMVKAMNAGDYTAAAKYLNHILELRDLFVACDLWPAFSTAMNMLGYGGNFGPDYMSPIREECVPKIRETLVRIGELS